MNLHDTIEYLSQVNTRTCHPKRLEEIEKDIPYFHIRKDDIGKYQVEGYAYHHHDNAPRMDLWCNYMRHAILPNIDPLADVSGFYNIELHDSYTYLNNGKVYKDVMCFSKFKKDDEGVRPVLIPDPYQMCNYGNMLAQVSDTQEWTSKLDKVVFCGTTTGNRDPLTNQRINMCLWSLDKKQKYDFYITKVAQMNLTDVLSRVPKFKEIYRPPLSIEDQLKYRYHLVMDGNTCRFDIWYYKTNNVVLKYDSKEMLWYYPLIQSGVHHVDVNKDNIGDVVNIYDNNPNLAQVMMYNAKQMSTSLFRPIVHQMYTINLFENISWNK